MYQNLCAGAIICRLCIIARLTNWQFSARFLFQDQLTVNRLTDNIPSNNVQDRQLKHNNYNNYCLRWFETISSASGRAASV